MTVARAGNVPVVPLAERYRDHFLVRLGPTPDPTECWRWRGAINNNGYGTVGMKDDATGRKYIALAHRISYTMFVGPIPKGLVIDHLCNNRLCCRPSHLRVCTQEENTAREHRERRPACRSCGTPYVFLAVPKGRRRRHCPACAEKAKPRDAERVRVKRFQRYQADPEWRARTLAANRRSRARLAAKRRAAAQEPTP